MLELSQDWKIAALTISYCVHLFLAVIYVDDQYFMKEALKEAEKAFIADEVPVGCVIVFDGEIISRGYNLKESSNVATRHAEMICIDNACGKLKSWRLNDCVLYVTLEPCLMCWGAILESRISKVVFGLKRENEQLFEKKQVEVVGDVCAVESLELLQKFFSMKRKG